MKYIQHSSQTSSTYKISGHGKIDYILVCWCCKRCWIDLSTNGTSELFRMFQQFYCDDYDDEDGNDDEESVFSSFRTKQHSVLSHCLLRHGSFCKWKIIFCLLRLYAHAVYISFGIPLLQKHQQFQGIRNERQCYLLLQLSFFVDQFLCQYFSSISHVCMPCPKSLLLSLRAIHI